MTILHELHMRRPDILYRNEVYIDGGITRGTDVLKALCLGARAVGLGRAFLYGNSVWGEPGVRRVIQSKLLLGKHVRETDSWHSHAGRNRNWNAVVRSY